MQRNDFRNYLQQEFLRRSRGNPAYSLRAYAKQLRINHATLSTILSGKRNLTKASILKFAKALNLGPNEISQFTQGDALSRSHKPSYYTLQQDTFIAMSDWYFDAVLELSIIPNFKLEPDIISQSIGITSIQAKMTLETLKRLDLLKIDKNGRYKLSHQNTTNILNPDFTTAAQKKYQRSVLRKSLEALESVDPKRRDHTSTTIAVDVKDLRKARELIKKFRYDLNTFLQRDGVKANEVYQLQVSFFPLTKNQLNEENL